MLRGYAPVKRQTMAAKRVPAGKDMNHEASLIGLPVIALLMLLVRLKWRGRRVQHPTPKPYPGHWAGRI